MVKDSGFLSSNTRIVIIIASTASVNAATLSFFKCHTFQTCLLNVYQHILLHTLDYCYGPKYFRPQRIYLSPEPFPPEMKESLRDRFREKDDPQLLDKPF